MRAHTVEQLRNALGLSREEFARSLGISRQRVWQIERGRDARGRTLGASGQLALKIADKYRDTLHRLGLTTEDLMRGRRAA